MTKRPEFRRASRTHVLAVAVASTLVGTTVSAVHAQSFPDRPLRIITGYLPGGVSDTIARVLGEQLGQALDQPVLIDGRPGAGGMLSLQVAAKATADGHTMYLAQPVISIAAAIDRYPWDVVKAFAPVGRIGVSMTLLAATPKFPVKSVKEMITYARNKPGALDYGSSGFGGPNHIAMELFQQMTKVKMNHVPYKGAGATAPALISGEVPVAVMPLLAGIPHVKAGRVTPLGVTGRKRASALPDVPAINETVPGFAYESWFGFLLPAGAPRPVVMRLNSELNKILDKPDIREKLATQGVDTEGSTPEELGRLMAEDAIELRKLFKETGIKLN